MSDQEGAAGEEKPKEEPTKEGEDGGEKEGGEKKEESDSESLSRLVYPRIKINSQDCDHEL